MQEILQPKSGMSQAKKKRILLPVKYIDMPVPKPENNINANLQYL